MKPKNKLIYNIWILSKCLINKEIQIKTNIGIINLIDEKRNIKINNNFISLTELKILTLKQILNELKIEKKCNEIYNNSSKNIDFNKLKEQFTYKSKQKKLSDIYKKTNN